VSQPPSTLVICCGAVAREITAIVRRNNWEHIRVQCLAPELHNDPQRLLDGVRAKIRDNRERFDRMMVLYSDCGTGGGMQKMLDEEGVEGIGGAHCYEVFAGPSFSSIIEEEPGCFFVTDFLARNFERLVFRGLGLDRYPKLRDVYFGRYRKLVYLAQSRDPETRAKAEAAAESIGLEFEFRYTGFGDYEPFLQTQQGAS
jgi:hypothetical protein